MVFLLLTGIIYSQQEITRYNGRADVISLSGEWKFKAVEPYIDAVETRTGKFDPPQYISESVQFLPQKFVTYPNKAVDELKEWKNVTVPNAWEQWTSVDYNDAGWYKKMFTPPGISSDDHERIWMEFDAVATAAIVWINGTFAGRHIGDYQRFRFDITDLIQPGENELLVYVDELPGHITQGFLTIVAPHHGGIWQDVRLYKTGSASVDVNGVYLYGGYDDPAVNFEIALDGDADPATTFLRISAGDENPEEPMEFNGSSEEFLFSLNELEKNERGMYTGSFTVKDFETWSPENPFMHLAKIELLNIDSLGSESIHDCYWQPYAHRTIEFDGASVFLNGNELHIRSALNWGNYPRIVSPAPPLNVLKDEFAYLKSLGFNAETVCLMVMPDYFYDLADRTGMIIWQEYPTWHNDFTKQHLPAYRRLYPGFFMRDRNHPSILLRSMTVEAGIQDYDVMLEILGWAREMTNTPAQDNSAWFWLSNEEHTDWYGEDNYFNNRRWARHMLIDLPNNLDTLPLRPYIIGESISATSWTNQEGLLSVLQGQPLANGITGVDDPGENSEYPYWFPLYFGDALDLEEALRERYNETLPEGMDIVNDVLMPQSLFYAKEFRKFQIQLLRADPRYAGFTVLLIRDVPQVHTGLYDDLGNPRWRPEDMDWLGEHTAAPVTTEEVAGRDHSLDNPELFPELLQWSDEWELTIERSTELYCLQSETSNIAEIFTDWANVSFITEDDIAGLPEQSIIVSDVLTYPLVSHMEQGGCVLLRGTKWKGGLECINSYNWRGAYFVPPAGPFTLDDSKYILKLHQFDLTHSNDLQIPVDRMGIGKMTDPLIRMYDTHDMHSIGMRDQLFATRVGQGLFIAGVIDYDTKGGEWLLGKLLGWADNWLHSDYREFPVTTLPVDTLMKFAVKRVNTFMSLEKEWKFKTDKSMEGESLGYTAPEFDDSSWESILAGRMWEMQNVEYDGMAWYRKEITVPLSAAGKNVYLVAEGVDDAYKLYINGEFVARHGSFTEHSETVFMTKTETDITDYITPGKEHLFVIQVVDIFGGGGINRPIYIRIE